MHSILDHFVYHLHLAHRHLLRLGWNTYPHFLFFLASFFALSTCRLTLTPVGTRSLQQYTPRQVPNAYIEALGKGTGLSGWCHISPGFYVRYCLSERLRDLGRMIEILRTVSLESLSDSDLREACDARAINVGNRLGGDREPQDLRKPLGGWLDLTSPEVSAGSKLDPDSLPAGSN
ncbi:unnamed protein product [Ectocarpus sp. CCAP 1310/34]|nr:unnamed protein product [Ectocarpus sp. CCAP 1310/34]